MTFTLPEIEGVNRMTGTKQDLTYSEAIRTLNKAAYAAIRAGKDTTDLPDIDRHSLRLIASETDRLVDYLTTSGLHPARISERSP